MDNTSPVLKQNNGGDCTLFPCVNQIVEGLRKSTLSSAEDDHDHAMEIQAVGCSTAKNFIINKMLFKRKVKIRSTPEFSQNARRERRFAMASRRLISPELSSTMVLIDKENDSPRVPISSPLKMTTKMAKFRTPFEDYDPNSQDSGYGASSLDSSESSSSKPHKLFRFAEPSGVPPRRIFSASSPLRSSPHKLQSVVSNLSKKFTDYDSSDDGFNELVDMDPFMENVQIVPNGLRTLISSEIIAIPEENLMDCDEPTTPDCPRTRRPKALRRSLTYHSDESCSSPPTSKVRSCLFRSPNATSSVSKLKFDRHPRDEIYSSPSSPPFKTFKRPEPPTDVSPVLVKRLRPCPSVLPDWSSPTSTPCMSRSQSEPVSHLLIKSAITRSTANSDLTGDFSRACILPLEDGHHEDLKSISSETLAALIRGEFNDTVRKFTIVDCRYPYEYEAGHIDGALNLYTKEMIEENLITTMTACPTIQSKEYKRDILVFHCEFSFERGPNLSRFLRNIDRKINKDYYPALHYPEIYLLHGGYKEFHLKQIDMCSPKGYKPMIHPDNERELRKFRSKGKSWNYDKKTTLTARTSFKRLGF